jgi:hypothetical protein
MTVRLPLGVSDSLFQIFQGVLRDGAQTEKKGEKSIVQRSSEAGAPAVGYSLFVYIDSRYGRGLPTVFFSLR